MIRRKHKRPVRRQILAAHDCKSMSYREVNSEQRKTNMMRDTFEQTALTPHAAEAFTPGSARCHALVEAARVPLSLGSGKNCLRLARCEADKIADIMKDSRCDKDQAVKTIQQTAMTRNELGGVFKTEIALDRGEH